MEPQLSEQQILVDLGLTLKQARIYLALAKYGPSRIIDIATNAKVARPDVYPNLKRLRQISIVEKLIKTPPEYRAVPMKEALPFLLEAKTSQYERIKAQTKILQSEVENQAPEESRIESIQFTLVPEGKVVDRIGASIEKAEKSIEVVVSWKRFSYAVMDALSENLETAWAKKLRIRLIVEKPPTNETTQQIVEYYRQKPATEIRFIEKYPETVFGIYDGKEVSMMTVPKTDLQGSPGLWSSNAALISLVKDYFERLWREATESFQ